jgi:hypothetical protein
MLITVQSSPPRKVLLAATLTPFWPHPSTSLYDQKQDIRDERQARTASPFSNETSKLADSTEWNQTRQISRQEPQAQQTASVQNRS